ncbi:MAG: ABC transporter permease [Anaerolineales bacterium]|nr:ABC transporter permease [Anaerolineales bacterium]
MANTLQTEEIQLSPEATTVPQVARVSPGRRFLSRLSRNRGAVVGLMIVLAIALAAAFAPVIAPHDPDQQFASDRLAPPSAEFPLGTDNLGRDILSRLLYGARPSVGSAALATVVILFIGIIVGLWAGYVGGYWDGFSMRVVDVFLAFPALILALAIVGVLGPGLDRMLLAIILVVWAYYARLVRGIVLELRERPYVRAAIALGGRRMYIMRRHILPNIISPVIVLASLQMGFLILTTAGLSFLGLGIQPPNAEWGAMLNDGRNFFLYAPQLMIYPGIMISLTVLGFNLLGDGLRDVLDPRHIQ